MSANINFNEDSKQYSFASAKEPAWHGHGQILDHVMTSEEAIENAHLNYEVEKRKIYIKEKASTVGPDGIIHDDNFGREKEVPNLWATVRSDNNEALGIVGSKYTVLQNKDAFKFFDSIVGDGEAIYETAGALGRGERVFITAKLPQKLVITPNDVIDQYLFLTNSHDGSGCIKAAFTPVRIVCANTLAMALRKSKYSINIRHTASAETNLKQAHNLMGIVLKKGEDLQEAYKAMTKVMITDKELKKFIEIAMRPTEEQISEEEFSTQFKNKIEAVLEYAHTDDTQLMETTKGTLFGAVNSITGYYNNVIDYKNPEDKLNQVIYGTGNRNSNRAYDLGIAYLTDNTILS